MESRSSVSFSHVLFNQWILFKFSLHFHLDLPRDFITKMPSLFLFSELHARSCTLPLFSQPKNSLHVTQTHSRWCYLHTSLWTKIVRSCMNIKKVGNVYSAHVKAAFSLRWYVGFCLFLWWTNFRFTCKYSLLVDTYSHWRIIEVWISRKYSVSKMKYCYMRCVLCWRQS